MKKNKKNDDEATKPIRNIFKMSRVLVNAKDKFKAAGKENATKNALKKINDADD